MASPFFNVSDPMASSRRLMELGKPKPPFDPTATTRMLMDVAKPKPPFDPTASSRRLMELGKPKPPFDPTATTRMLMDVAKPKPPFDPMASSRRLMESWLAQKSFDPLDKYQQILERFSKVVSSPTGTPEDELVAAPDLTSGRPALHSMPSAALAVALIGIAWTCAWMVAQGADINALGGLFIEALGLALYISEHR